MMILKCYKLFNFDCGTQYFKLDSFNCGFDLQAWNES